MVNILTPMFAMGIFDTPNPNKITKYVTHLEHDGENEGQRGAQPWAVWPLTTVSARCCFSNVTTAAHNQLARTLSAQSHILLKNEGGLLPLDKSTTKKIVVIGEQGDKNVVIGGGGSGDVRFKGTRGRALACYKRSRVSSPLTARPAPCPAGQAAVCH